MSINFKVSFEDSELIQQIAERADREIFKPLEVQQSLMDTVMDLTATHANGCPLKLPELLGADEFNFAHDVAGIRRHINRKTGRLENCFLPRFAKGQNDE